MPSTRRSPPGCSSAFRSWKALEPERRRQAKKTLQRIAEAKPLSHDVHEIVGKMLE